MAFPKYFRLTTSASSKARALFMGSVGGGAGAQMDAFVHTSFTHDTLLID